MIADNFPSKAVSFIDRALVAADELKETMTGEGISRQDRWFDSVAAAEAWGVVYDIQTNKLFQIDDGWQTFTNFWMDWMWAQKLQRNYVKLALVMQSIAKRDGWVSANGENDFDTWVGLAKRCQGRYFALIVSVLLILCVALSALTGTAQAATENATLTYLGTEVLDENGIAVPNNAYYVDCDGEQLTVSIEVRFVGGTVQLLTSDSYCQAKIYIVGSIELIEIVAVAGGPDAVMFVYLPMIGG